MTIQRDVEAPRASFAKSDGTIRYTPQDKAEISRAGDTTELLRVAMVNSGTLNRMHVANL